MKTDTTNPDETQDEIYEEIDLKHHFTEAEQVLLGRAVSRALEAIAGLEEQKKEVVDQFKADISAQQAKANSASRKINAGYEMRKKQCQVRFRPKDKEKDFILDGEVVATRPMTPEDFQMDLLKEQAAESADPAAKDEFADDDDFTKN